MEQAFGQKGDFILAFGNGHIAPLGAGVATARGAAATWYFFGFAGRHRHYQNSQQHEEQFVFSHKKVNPRFSSIAASNRDVAGKLAGRPLSSNARWYRIVC